MSQVQNVILLISDFELILICWYWFKNDAYHFGFETNAQLWNDIS